MSPDSPRTRSQILEALADIERDVAVFFNSLSDEEFVLRAGTAWTPAEHLQHLNIAVRAIARGLAVSPWLLRLIFGSATCSSRTYEEIRETYLTHLSRGAKAAPAYIPPRDEAVAGRIPEHRAELLARWARVNAAVRNALSRWREQDLDRTTLPHPILKKITARELLLFMLYHDQHHIARVKARLPRFSAAAEDEPRRVQ